MVEVDLVLAVAALVVAVLGGKAHLLHGQADVPAQVLGGVQGIDVQVAPEVQWDAGGAAPLVRLKEVELALGPHVAHQAQLAEPAGDLPQEAPAVAPKGLAARLLDVAEELHHPALGGPPGQDGQGGQVGPED